MEKKQKKGMKKLVISMIAMMLAIVGAATSTYAWFTMTAAPQVGQFDVKVATVSGLEVALDDRAYSDTSTPGAHKPTAPYTGLEYKTFITGQDIEDYILSIANTGSGGKVDAATALTLVPTQSTDGKTFMDLSGIAQAISAKDSKTNIGKFVGSEGTNQVGFLEFSLYFRVRTEDYNISGANTKVQLDMTNYTIGGTHDYKADTNAEDMRTYVGGGADADVTNFTLPTEWVGSQGLTAVVGDYYQIANYIIVKDTAGVKTIEGINMFKYYDDTNTDELYVNPANGMIREWNGTGWVADTTTVFYDSVANDDSGSVDNDGIEIAGQGANALRISFAEIKTANLIDKLDENTAVMWDPRNDLGNFDNNIAGNFALHMLWATDKAATNPGTTYVTDRAPTGELASKDIVTLDSTHNNNYHYGATTIRIWVDGWDAECFNGIMADIANIAFQFKLV